MALRLKKSFKNEREQKRTGPMLFGFLNKILINPDVG